MNWKQLHIATTPTEREELLISMLRTLEARQQRLILARGVLLRERRRARRLHYVRDRRTPPAQRHARNLLRSMIIFIAVTISAATWLIAANIQPMYGAPLVFGYDLLLLAILLIKPNHRQKLTANS